MGYSVLIKDCKQKGDPQLGDTMKRLIFGAFALRSVILVFTACGGETTATPPPTQDIALTTVITMAKADEIREIQIDGKELTVYPKIIAGRGVDGFVSRIGEDTDIIGLLIDSGVEVGAPSGVEVTIKGVSAEDVQAAISAALAQAASSFGDVLVTPTPVPAMTQTPTATTGSKVTFEPFPSLIPAFTAVPTVTSRHSMGANPTATPTPTANPTNLLLPQRPLIRMRHDGQVYEGEAGNFCWPVELGVSRCGVEQSFLGKYLIQRLPFPLRLETA